ncbi:MAG TPA: HEPN/Toprim-associated domain-containing protein [Acidimicrobiales bacterium]|nr:HEPN/Toprim-associated domain-containing protein [Acidimicrobiales bacterium]
MYLSDGREVCAFRDGVDQLFFVLFTKADHIELHGAEAYELTQSNYSDLEPDEAIVVGYRTRVDVLRDRLDLMGVDINAVEAVFEDIVAEEHARALSHTTPPILREVYARRVRLLESMTWSRWVDQLRDRLQAGEAVMRHGGRDNHASASWLMELWEYHDPRYRLRSLLEALPDDEVVTLDLADLDDDWRAGRRRVTAPNAPSVRVGGNT